MKLWTAIQARIASDEGASLVEYALLVALIAIVAIAAITFVGTSVSGTFNDIGSSI
ncbi:MAG: Flp family type IVb pilin [Acidobacteria bacterium]|nr:Flp family type IVb pilin [Acidobacteriota bacterium]